MKAKYNWYKHPHVQNEVKLGDRAADAIRGGMGSWPFVILALLFLAGWIFSNGQKGPDPYPFILLNLLLSCLAALQGAILLIASKRTDQISSELALHNYEVNRESLALLKEIREHLR